MYHFRYCFPFGRPEGALKATLSLLERVLMKDIVTPVPPEEVRGMIKKCLETAALVNYTRLSSEAKIEGQYTIQSVIHTMHHTKLSSGYYVDLETVFTIFARTGYNIRN